MNAKSEFAFGAEREVASSRSPAVSLGSRQAAAGAGEPQNIPGNDAFTDSTKLRFYSSTGLEVPSSVLNLLK